MAKHRLTKAERKLIAILKGCLIINKIVKTN